MVSDEIVPDKAVDSFVPSGDESTKSLEGRNIEPVIISENIESVPMSSELALRKSNRVLKLPEKLRDYDVSINCTKS